MNAGQQAEGHEGPTDGGGDQQNGGGQLCRRDLDGALVGMAEAQAPETLLGARAVGELGASGEGEDRRQQDRRDPGHP